MSSSPPENAPDQQETAPTTQEQTPEETPPQDTETPPQDDQTEAEADTEADTDGPRLPPVMAGQMTGTVDTTDVGAGAGAFLETNTDVDFSTRPGEIDGDQGEDYEDTEGANPMFRSEDETQELIDAEAEQREADHDNAMERRAAAEEAEEAARKAREEQGEEEQVVTTEPPPASGVDGEFEEPPAEEPPAEEPPAEEPPAEEPAAEEPAAEEPSFDPSEHTTPEVQAYLDSADEAERERVLALERQRQPNGRVGILTYEPKG